MLSNYASFLIPKIMDLRFAMLHVGHNTWADTLKKRSLFTARTCMHETHLPPANSRNSSWQQDADQPSHYMPVICSSVPASSGSARELPYSKYFGLNPLHLTFWSLAVSLRTTRCNFQKFYMALALRWVFCTDIRTDSDFCFIRR